VLRTHRGNTIDLAGNKLKDVLPRLKREIIDVEVEVSFKRAAKLSNKEEDSFEVYHPKGKSKVTENFRLIGTFDEYSKTYHLYITNITPEQLSAEDVALLYKARWSIELLFKELKRIYPA
jgi:IS4 transposase